MSGARPMEETSENGSQQLEQGKASRDTPKADLPSQSPSPPSKRFENGLRSSMIKTNQSRESSEQRTFGAFLKVARFSQNPYVKWGTFLIIFVDFVFAISLYLLMTAKNLEDEDFVLSNDEIIPLTVIGYSFAFLSGVRQLLLLALGSPIILHSGLMAALILDVLVWLTIMVVKSVGLKKSAVTSEDLPLLASVAFLCAIRLNTYAVMNIAINSLTLDRQHHSETHHVIGVSLDRIATLVRNSGIPTLYQDIIITYSEEVDVDSNGVVDQLEFLSLLHKTLIRIDIWKHMTGKRQEFDDLVAQLEFYSLLTEQDLSGLEGDENTEESSILGTMTIAIRLMMESQPCLFVTLVVALCLVALSQPAFSMLVGILVNIAVDLATENQSVSESSEFWMGLIGLGAIFLANEALFYLSSFLAARLIANATASIQYDFAQIVVYSDVEFLDNYRPTTLNNVFNAGLAKTQQVWDFILFEMILSVASIISAIIFLGLIDVSYMIFVLCAIPFILSLTDLQDKAMDSSDKADASLARLGGRFQNTVSLSKAGKISNSGAFLMEKFVGPLSTAKKDSFYQWFWGNIVAAVFSTVAYGLNAITTIVFLYALADGQIDSGRFFSLTGFVTGIIEPLERFGAVSGTVAQMSGAVLKVNEILRNGKENVKREDHANNEADGDTLQLEKHLTFEEVQFSYSPESPLVIKNVSASVPKGSYVCIFGGSGSGKTTLLNLLIGFRRCTGGRIRMDDVDISSVPQHCLRDALAVVFQETLVLDGTIMDNIAFGCDLRKRMGKNDTADKTRATSVMNAARRAGIHDFIETLPDKYETLIGKEATLCLSGGQLQRICGISRALARNPKLLVLDEFSSALDSISEQHIVQNIEQLRDDGLTIVSVTHHPITAVNADQIIVLDKGVVAQTGTYDELVSKPGLFLDLVEAGHSATDANKNNGDSNEGDDSLISDDDADFD